MQAPLTLSDSFGTLDRVAGERWQRLTYHMADVVTIFEALFPEVCARKVHASLPITVSWQGWPCRVMCSESRYGYLHVV